MSTDTIPALAPGDAVHVVTYDEITGIVVRQAVCDCPDAATAGGLWEIAWPCGCDLVPFMHGCNLVKTA